MAKRVTHRIEELRRLVVKKIGGSKRLVTIDDTKTHNRFEIVVDETDIWNILGCIKLGWEDYTPYLFSDIPENSNGNVVLHGADHANDLKSELGRRKKARECREYFRDCREYLSGRKTEIPKKKRKDELAAEERNMAKNGTARFFDFLSEDAINDLKDVYNSV